MQAKASLDKSVKLMDDLKPCPFCGGEAQMVANDQGDTMIYYAECMMVNCPARPELRSRDSLQEAAAAWNMRAAQSKPDATPLDDFEHPISQWFELSYAQFLTVPRLVMEAMPLRWQLQMAALLQEMDDTFDWRPKEGRYWVRLKDDQGRFTYAPLDDYRHGSVEHLRIPKA